MSEYIEFFVKNGENYSPIDTFNRSTQLYQVALKNGVPYEGLRPIDMKFLNKMRADLERLKHERQCEIRKQQDYITFLQGARMEAQEKNAAYEDTINLISEHESKISQLDDCIRFCKFLGDIIDSGKFYSEFIPGIKDAYLWAGIEVPLSLIDIED